MEAPTMEALAGRIDSTHGTFGFEKEKRAFRAHITLARAKHRPLDAALVTAANQFEEQRLRLIHCRPMFSLPKHIDSNGPVYTKLKEYLLS